MKISVDEIPETPREIDFSESVADLNHIDSRESGRDFEYPPALAVHLVYFRSGRDLFFSGRLHGEFTGRCGRCAEPFGLTLDQPFDFILTPEAKSTGRGAEELHRDDMGLSGYASDEIDLAPLIAEQAMLGLPTRPLCGDACRGLCGACGANLNLEGCDCSKAGGDPRMALFRTLKVGRP
jgi:uncharacterized protein